jgi:hypothetical protein
MNYISFLMILPARQMTLLLHLLMHRMPTISTVETAIMTLLTRGNHIMIFDMEMSLFL